MPIQDLGLRQIIVVEEAVGLKEEKKNTKLLFIKVQGLLPKFNEKADRQLAKLLCLMRLEEIGSCFEKYCKNTNK